MDQNWKEEQLIKISICVGELGLQMKLIDCEYVEEAGDKKLFVYYKARKRVDFRQLCRDLHKMYGCRIEMRRLTDRQIAQRLGGVNTCKHSRIPCFIPWCHTNRWGGCFYDKSSEEVDVPDSERSAEIEG